METSIIIAVLFALAYVVIKQRLKVKVLKAKLIITEELFTTNDFLTIKTLNNTPEKILKDLKEELSSHYFNKILVAKTTEIGNYLHSLQPLFDPPTRAKRFIIKILENTICRLESQKLSEIMISLVKAISKKPKESEAAGLEVMKSFFLNVINYKMNEAKAELFYLNFSEEILLLSGDFDTFQYEEPKND